LQITPTLFGEWSLVREWGRIGSPGTVRLESFESEAQAYAEEQRTMRLRIRHGYKVAA
jgi:predicted DNA-binding WGR domain protein